MAKEEYLSNQTTGSRDAEIVQLKTELNGLKTSMVGMETMFPPTSLSGAISSSWVSKSGQTLSRAAYPALWQWIKLTGNYITDAEWISKQLSNGYVDEYSSGDGSTTFRMPLNPVAVEVFNESRDIIAPVGSYSLNAEFKLDIDIEDYECLIASNAFSGDTASITRNSLVYPKEFLFSGNALVLGSSDAGTTIQHVLLLVDSRTVRVTQSVGGYVRYIVGIRKAKAVLPNGLHNLHVFSGNYTTNLPEVKPDWLAQQEANSLKIAEFESNRFVVSRKKLNNTFFEVYSDGTKHAWGYYEQPANTASVQVVELAGSFTNIDLAMVTHSAAIITSSTSAAQVVCEANLTNFNQLSCKALQHNASSISVFAIPVKIKFDIWEYPVELIG